MTQAIRAIQEWHNMSREKFEQQVLSLNQPAVFRSLVADWPAVKKQHLPVAKFVEYLKSYDNGEPAYTIVGKPEIQGRFFYSDDLSGVNFKRANVNFSSVIDQIAALENHSAPHAIAVQSASVAATLPEFDQLHAMPLLNPEVSATMWVGNRATVAAHYDTSDNLAAVVYGRRTFTLFPPDQVANLYVGPALESPGGVPISLVELNRPDLDKFPNFAAALAEAQSATLEPGDVIYIPSPWWHAVESLDPFNMLINFWWGMDCPSPMSPNHSLMHALLTIGGMPADKRRAWQHFFNYYVFKESGDPADHLPSDLNDVLTELSEEQLAMLRAFLKSKL